MVAVQRGLLVLMAAGALALPSQVPVDTDSAGSPVRKDAVAAPAYDAGQREAYLTPGQLDYIRPGLKVTINSVERLEPGQKPVVEFTITDDFGNPLDRTGSTTAGTVTYRFIVAIWDGKYYTNQLGIGGNPTRDNTGTTQTLDIGHYKYTFNAALPTKFDATKATTLFGGFARNTTDLLGKNYYVQAFKDGMPPDLKTAATTYGVTTTARCNQCHDPLALHGGNYREIKTCALCHNPNNMVGQIPGSGGEPAEERSTYNGQHFWHLIHSEQWEGAAEITYPQLVQDCDTCHDTTKQSNGAPTAPQGTAYLTQPSRAACGGCHTSVNFATGAGHSDANLPQANDNDCATCHTPDSGSEWDASIKGAHVLPAESKQLKGLNIAILSVTNTAPGQKPTVTFKITENDGTFVKPSSATGGASVSLVIAGTTADYGTIPISQTATAAIYDPATGICTYIFTTAIPADAKGTWSMSASTRRTATLNQASGGTRSFTEGPKENPIYDFAVTGTKGPARRAAVDLAKCNACHSRLATTFSHGGQRISIQYCVMCHNPVNSDVTRRPAADGPAESIEMARMIHRIHTGEELTQAYGIYGNSGTNTPFNEVTYPGDRRNCLACHTNAAAYDLPMPAGTINVITLRDYFTPQGSGTAACLGCHDSRDAAAHAYLNTAPFGEACGTCHGGNADWSVAKVHAR